MTVRTAELLIAILLALCSIGLMVKSSELHIGWIEDKGPGSGAWPFWLSFGMLVTCLITIYRWFKGLTPESRNLELFMTGDTVIVVGMSALSILGLLVGTMYVGIYISLIVFLLFYLKVIGHHTWALTISLAICIPFFIFCLFEVALTIPLPKAITDPAFYPVYDLIYAQSFKDAVMTLRHPIVSIPLLAVFAVLVYWLKQWINKRKMKRGLDSNAESSSTMKTDSTTGEERS